MQSLNKHPALKFSAGPAAYAEIQRDGFRPGRIGTIAAASGGAKWLVLSQLDRAIARRVLPKLEGPVYTIGTSIGAWRMACYAQQDPVAAIERFEQAYLSQSYSAEPDRNEISLRTAEILDVLLGADGARQILSHPILRTHIMTVRSRHLTSSEHYWVLGTGLAAAAGLNVLSRKSLGLFFDRVLFFDERTTDEVRAPFFSASGFPMYRVPLSTRNVQPAIIATGAIPMIMNGVMDIAGAPPGMYRDGGVIDYHIDLPQSASERLSLFPHFYDYVKPGWFDKRLSWRRPNPRHVDRMLLISPSAEFVARLPNRKIPDRQDFISYSAADRVRIWRKVIDACKRLADDFESVIENDQMAARLEVFGK